MIFLQNTNTLKPLEKEPQDTKAPKKNVSFSSDTKPAKEVFRFLQNISIDDLFQVVEQEPPKKVSKFKQERMQQK